MKNSFLVYFNAMRYGYNRSKYQYNMEIIAMGASSVILLWALSITHTEVSQDSYFVNWSFFFWWVWLAFLSVGTVLRIKPSLINLLPLTAKRKTFYLFAYTFLLCIIFVIFLVLFFIVFWFIVGIIVSLATGYWIFVFEETDTIYMPIASLQGGFYDFFLVLLVAACGAIVAFTEKRKLRLALTLGFPVALMVFSFILVNAASADTSFVLYENLSLYFENLPLSWLWLTFIALVSVGTAVYAVIKAYKWHKPKNY